MKTYSSQHNNQWQHLHLVLQDLLAGYHDNELDEHQRELVEAHLAGCNDCRNDLVRQQALCASIERLPVERLSQSSHQQIEQALLNSDDLASLSQKKRATSFANKMFSGLNRFISSIYSTQKLYTSSGWAVAAVLVVVLLLPSQTTKILLDNHKIPMIDDALTQYKQLQQQNLPTSSSGPITAAPLGWDQAKLLVSWPTIIGGAPAEAFAIRHNNQVVLQYKINQVVLLRNAKIRQAIAIKGIFRTQTATADIMVLPAKDAGLIIVGPVNSLPSRDNISASST